MLPQSRALPQAFSVVRYFGLALSVALFSLLLFPRVFMENDDIGFIYLLTHGLYAPWISKVCCELLLYLYGHFPSFGWYGILHYSLLTIDLGILLMLTSDWAQAQRLSAKLQWVLIGVVILLFYPFFLKITFTCTCILSLGIGLMGLLTILNRQEQARSAIGVNSGAHALAEPGGVSPSSHSFWSVLGFGCIFSVGYLVRPEGLGTLIFLFPVLLYGMLAARKTVCSRKGMRLGLVFLAPLLLWLILEKGWLHYPAAQVPYLHYVVQSNNAFGFGFTELLKRHPEWLSSIGWTRADFGMLERFLYWDDQVFSQARITALSQLLPQALGARLQEVLTPATLLSSMLRTFQKTWLSNFPFTLYCVGLYLLFVKMGTSRAARCFPALALGVVFLESLLMQAVLRFPYRVAYPVITVSALSLLALPGFSVQRLFSSSGRLQPVSRMVLLFTAASLLIFNGPVRLWKSWTAPVKQTRALLAGFNQLQTTHYILRESSVIPVSSFDPLDPMPLSAPDIGPGWLIHSLPFYARLQQFGVANGAGLIPASFDNPQILYFFKDQNLPVLQDFIGQHYHRLVQFVPVQVQWLSSQHKNRHLYRVVARPERSEAGTKPIAGP